MIGSVDRRDHSPAALARPLRKRATTAIVLHRTINIDADKDSDRDADDVFAFFCKDPEGVATVAVGGSYASKKNLIESWRKHGIPASHRYRGFCPYHLLVDDDGVVTQALSLEVVGAHAGDWNDRSVAVAVIADPRTEVPTKKMVAAVVDVCAQLLARFPGAVIVDHDFVNAAIHAPHKGCIGAKFPFVEVRAKALAKAGIAEH